MAPPSSPSLSLSPSAAMPTSVQVAVRIRPTTSQDLASIPARFQRTIIHAASTTAVTVDAVSSMPAATGSATAVTPSTASAPKKQVFSFDQVHPATATQHDLFIGTAQPLIFRFLEGFNCTILAYGQTSSGKTFTMTGVDLDANPSDPNNGMGIIPRAVSTIFAQAKKLKEERGENWNFSLKGSFIEIYNEDLIDLLSLDDSSGGRREVQIREGKDGQIIWGGLREVNVRNSNEVMTLIRQGTSIRRTNETDMNAQSSRSHAIFSLTLTQRKFIGPAPTPRSSSPLPVAGRSPSRLARPGSMYTSPRVSSPTPGRPSTPSFASAMGRGGGLRPASSLGLHPSDSRSGGLDEDAGEWVTVTSKFHFVDLAGSERLKRTAAAGERIKEGISINSGLLALGNVISALGDPSRAKSHTASHIPYRDSKLTRLLQDSLGGNAHTLMIACVSPTEWNAGETINTLKYANRARNIKNRVTINEKEDGWDDVEWLRGTVTRLRKELKQLKDGGVSISSTSGEIMEGAGKRMLAQMSDLQNNYEDMREKYVERTEELTRLRRELGERYRTSSSGAVGGTAKYEEIVGPVIEEYEKTISAMEAELNLNRAALRHTNDLVEEKEEELTQLTERHSATELYVEELRSRIAKLTEREAATEAYIRDLEEKIKSYDESSMSSSDSITDLKKEVAQYKDAEAYSAKYIADLDARLARSDESVITLQQTVERLEAECERRREEVRVMQNRLENFEQDGASWRSDLEERERKVKDLEQQMEEWEQRRKDASDDRMRLNEVVDEVVRAKSSFENLNSSSGGTSASGVSTPQSRETSIESQFLALQQTHTATLADLSAVTAKYRDALREISDLAAQIQEAKLGDSPSPEKPSIDIPPFKRRMTSPRLRDAADQPATVQGKRLLYRQAASTESLHARSVSQSQSQSLSQELSSARLRKASISSHGTSSSVSHSPSHSRPNMSFVLSGASNSPTDQRSVMSLEKEIMRLQEVLKEREAEITTLESSLKERDQELPSHTETDGGDDSRVHLSPATMTKFDAIRRSMELHGGKPQENGHAPEMDVDESLDRLNEVMLSMAQKESRHKEQVDTLNDQLAQIRRQHDELTALSRDQALNMSTEIEGFRNKHDSVLMNLKEVQKHEAELLEALQTAESCHTAAIEALRVEHAEALRAKTQEVELLFTRTKEEHATSLDSVYAELSASSAALEKAHQEHKELFGKLQAEHEEDLRSRLQDTTDLLKRSEAEHADAVAKIRAEYDGIIQKKEEDAASALQRTEEEYYNALTKLRTDHAEALQKQASDNSSILERLKEDHASELRMAEKARECSLSESQSSRALAIKDLQDEHAAAVARKEAALKEDMEKLKAEHTRILSSKDEDYRTRRENLRLEHSATLARLGEESELKIDQLNSELTRIREESATKLAKVNEEHDAALVQLREDHASALQNAQRIYEEEISRLKVLHVDVLKEAEGKASQDQLSLEQSHTRQIAEMRAAHEQRVSELQAEVTALQEHHRVSLEESRQQNERHSDEERARLKTTIDELEQQYSQERDIFQKDRDLLSREFEQYKAAADEARSKMEQLRAQEQTKSASLLAELQQRHAREIEAVRKDQEALKFDLESQKEAARDFAAVRGMHEKAMKEQTDLLGNARKELWSTCTERDALAAEVVALKAQLSKTLSEQSELVQEASKRQSLVEEIEKHRSILAELQENLQRVKDERDTLQADKMKQESVFRDLQVQLSRNGHTPDGTPGRPPADRTMSFSRVNGIGANKLPPPTPPPSIPPPPAPKTSLHGVNGDSQFSIMTQSSGVMSSTSSKESQLDTPPTSVGHSVSTQGIAATDTKALTAKLEEQTKHITEQDAMIKTLNKQLSHCENDLATHMDLVSTLETSLGDSEKNLRKARMQATELVRERDALNSQVESLRNELQEAKQEVVHVRRSIAEEKQSLESRLDEERRAKERARAQLDSRMDELQKRKSKFVCL